MAIEQVGAIEGMTRQAAAQPTSSAGVLQTGILAVMMIMMFTMDGRYQSVFGMIGHFFASLKRSLPELCGMGLCAIVTLYVCSFEPLPTTDSTQKLVRGFWPVMQDPDTLLAVHAMLRVISLVSLWYRSRQSWPVPASFLHFSAVSLVAQIYLYGQESFAVEGPFAGTSVNALLYVALIMTLGLASQHRLHNGERVYPLAMISVVLVVGHAAVTNRLTIAEDEFSNAVFSFANFIDVAAMFHFAIFMCQSASNGELANSRADGMLFVMMAQKLALVYYLLDGFGLLPNSTLESIGVAVPSPEEMTGEGSPLMLIIGCQLLTLALMTLGFVAFFLGRLLAHEEKVGVVPHDPQVRAQRMAQARTPPGQQAALAPVQVPTGKLSTIVF